MGFWKEVFNGGEVECIDYKGLKENNEIKKVKLR